MTEPTRTLIAIVLSVGCSVCASAFLTSKARQPAPPAVTVTKANVDALMSRIVALESREERPGLTDIHNDVQRAMERAEAVAATTTALQARIARMEAAGTATAKNGAALAEIDRLEKERERLLRTREQALTTRDDMVRRANADKLWVPEMKKAAAYYIQVEEDIKATEAQIFELRKSL